MNELNTKEIEILRELVNANFTLIEILKATGISENNSKVEFLLNNYQYSTRLAKEMLEKNKKSS